MEDQQIVPACKKVEAQYVELRVPLYSYGCEKKVKKALSHFRGIYSVNVDYHQQKVTVWGICNKYDVLATIRNKRKEACFWNPEDSTEGRIMEQHAQTKSRSPSRPLPPKRSISFTLSKARALSWKLTLKKVFMRSDSF
ncbi:hypothetical protein RHSIM_Rhsim03G0216800 [Rhododendron simsii]|uniref:HMA domain-containing protein n=1 Tax=Rhododendron simsii TaxID=118357 RepID=A0A834LP60_RHOSS|nr:hypothetical protein RHSIM_Rhsim03G0216800 [Rhododendron simsii]